MINCPKQQSSFDSILDNNVDPKYQTKHKVLNNPHLDA
jgi:hypothetical protein